MKDDWIVLKGPVLDDLVSYLKDHQDEAALEAVFVTVIGRMPDKYCSHEEAYVELEAAARRQAGYKVGRYVCPCGTEIKVHYDPDNMTWERGLAARKKPLDR